MAEEERSCLTDTIQTLQKQADDCKMQKEEVCWYYPAIYHIRQAELPAKTSGTLLAHVCKDRYNM